MKKSLLTGISLSALLLAVAPGCREEDVLHRSESRGRISLGLDLNADPVNGTLQEASRAASPRTGISVDDLQLKLVSNDREWEQTYSSVDEFRNEESFPTGDYTLEAFYGKNTDQGVGSPYYYGEASFTVENRKETSVSLPVYLANSIVEVKVTQAFVKFMQSYSFTVTSSTGVSHTWTDSPDDDLYVPAGTTKVNISFTKLNGVKAENVEICSFEAKARHRHTVTVDYNGGEVGGTEALKINLDDAVEQGETTLDISDDIIVHSAPTLVADGFVTGSTFEIIEGCPHFDILAVNAIARGGIKSVMLTTQSAALAKKGFPAEVDLCNPGQYAPILEALKLKTRGLSNSGVMGVVDFYDFIGMIPCLANATDAENTSTFTITVTDSYGREAPNKIKFGIKVTPLDFELISAKFTKFGNVVVEFRFNGDHDHLDNGLHFYRNNSRGIEEEVKITSCSDEKHSEGLHIAELSYSYKNFVEDAGRYVIARTGHFESNKVDVTVNHGDPELKILNIPENVFATKAILTLENASTQKSYFQLSTDGDNFEDYNGGAVVNGTDSNFTLTGLTPNTKYWVRADVGNAISRTTTFTTEAATQLTNGNLDAATTNPNNIPHLQLFKGWGTNNTMTTDFNAAFGVTAEYVKTSGTILTDDAVKGKAALLRTIGWGSGNTNAGGVSVINYVDPGLLHLGAERTSRASNIHDTSDLDCGIAFASRPSSVSFSWKYSAVNNSDEGQALVRVIDAAGNIISEKILALTAQDSYKKETLSLTYNLGAPKAAKLYIRFLSSTKTPGGKDGNWLHYGSPHKGSELWIDEVTLNY